MPIIAANAVRQYSGPYQSGMPSSFRCLEMITSRAQTMNPSGTHFHARHQAPFIFRVREMAINRTGISSRMMK